ncbi:MAG: hypothetical protein OSJ27_09630 [Candidatus Gastranaerophilales bacterium]|nr:hypothetical protein [Candidatus Gastranaerophilales bacterium]
MLPEIDEENFNNVTNEILADISAWRKGMIHYIKEENPELNSAIIELANKTDLDPKAVATGAYMAYILIENASKKQDELLNFEEE